MSLTNCHTIPDTWCLEKREILTVSEFNEIRRGSYISRDDSNGEVRFIIRDLKFFWILTEITISPFFIKLEFSLVLQIWPFLLMYGSHDMRHTGFPQVDGGQRDPQGLGRHIYKHNGVLLLSRND